MPRYGLRNVLILCYVFAVACSNPSDDDLALPKDAEVAQKDTAGGQEEDGQTPENPDQDDSQDDSGNDSNEPSESGEVGDNTAEACPNPSAFVFEEINGLVRIEFEHGNFEPGSAWEIVEEGQVSGGSYAVWEGNDHLNAPGNGLITYRLNIVSSGIYRFIWNSAVTKGNNGTEHNDSWLRFPDAANFYGEKDNSRVYPRDTGQSPNPNGASKDGWFKVYRSGNDLNFKWQARTSDHDAHDIYVVFDTPGIYTMEVSGRSSGHGIDQIILFQETRYSGSEATGATPFSQITCN